MSALGVFFAGLFVSTICILAIVYSVKETQRLGREADERERSSSLKKRDHPV